jgi:hypothetical protein
VGAIFATFAATLAAALRLKVAPDPYPADEDAMAVSLRVTWFTTQAFFSPPQDVWVDTSKSWKPVGHDGFAGGVAAPREVKGGVAWLTACAASHDAAPVAASRENPTPVSASTVNVATEVTGT